MVHRFHPEAESVLNILLPGLAIPRPFSVLFLNQAAHTTVVDCAVMLDIVRVLNSWFCVLALFFVPGIWPKVYAIYFHLVNINCWFRILARMPHGGLVFKRPLIFVWIFSVVGSKSQTLTSLTIAPVIVIQAGSKIFKAVSCHDGTVSIAIHCYVSYFNVSCHVCDVRLFQLTNIRTKYLNKKFFDVYILDSWKVYCK